VISYAEHLFEEISCSELNREKKKAVFLLERN